MSTISQQVAEQLAAAAALPVVRIAPAPTTPSASLPRALVYATVTLAQHQSAPLNIPGDYLYIDTAAQTAEFSIINGDGNNLDRVSVKTDTSPSSLPLLRARQEIQFPTPFNSVTITNEGAAITLGVYVGFGRVGNATLFSDLQRVRPASKWMMQEKSLSPVITNYAPGDVMGQLPFAFLYPFAAQNDNLTPAVTLRKATLLKNSVGTAASFRIYFLSEIVLTVNDGEPFPVVYGGMYYIGMLDFPSFITGGGPDNNGAMCQIAGLDIRMTQLLSNKIEAYLVANTAYTSAANEKFNLILEFDQT